MVPNWVKKIAALACLVFALLCVRALALPNPAMPEKAQNDLFLPMLVFAGLCTAMAIAIWPKRKPAA
jgi:hypothetical protein